MRATPAAEIEQMYAAMRAPDIQGQQRPLHSQISRPLADALTRIVADNKPKLAIEIGMAYGLSALAILRGLPEDGKLLSIDPFQTSEWGRVGRLAVERTDRVHQHELIEEPDYLALPDMLRQGKTVDFAYIDGMHTFDYVLMDAFFIDKLLPVGGIVAFNDCGFRSIHKFLKFFRSHRRYEELDAGIEPNYRGRNALVSAVRRFEGRSNQDRYFRKLEAWEPAHNFFRRF